MVKMIEKNIDIYKFFIFENKVNLTSYLIEYISTKIKTSLEDNERFKFCVCGGSTPKVIYERLSNINLSWDYVDIFLGDERCVDPLSKESNTNMLKNSLLQNYASKAFFCELFKNKELNDDLAKQLFLKTLQEKCIGNPPIFDLTLLGLGDDGHTASLFPYKEINNNDLVITTFGKGLKRISLTPKIISASNEIAFLVTGASKNLALKRLINKNESPERTPAKLINSQSKILIFCDSDASNELPI
tara:strand:- start:656 stop:1390 length:735 start_codon:yes stop_codon:yes gene_type:complete